jgi:hypothetical protein
MCLYINLIRAPIKCFTNLRYCPYTCSLCTQSLSTDASVKKSKFATWRAVMSICFTSGLYLENPLNSLYISYSGILDWRLSAEWSLNLSSLGSARCNFASKSASFFFAAASRSSNPLIVRL